MGIVEFDGVSKRYRIGLTQASLPKFVSRLVRRALAPLRPGEQQDPYLWALRDISFSLEAGESLALVGANGAGKTTVLRLLANITKPTEGRVRVDGRLSALIELGAGFHPDLTGKDNAYLNGAILGIPRRELTKRLDDIVDFSGLSAFMDTPVKRYSPGMITRLGFAIAACVEPRVLLVDEVLAVGDAAFSQRCLERIETLRRAGTAVIFVSHNLYLVKAVCKHGIYLHRGQSRFKGSAEDAIRAYERDLHEERAAARTRPSNEVQPTGGLLDITAVEVCGAHGHRRSEYFRSTDAATVVVRYQASAAVPAATLALVIRRGDGAACCMLRTRDHDATFRIEKGEGHMAVRLNPLQLVSGTYFAEATVRDGADAVDLSSRTGQSQWFTVTGRGLGHEEQAGVFEPRFEILSDMPSARHLEAFPR